MPKCNRKYCGRKSLFTGAAFYSFHISLLIRKAIAASIEWEFGNNWGEWLIYSKERIMNNLIHIAATLDKPELLETMVEQLAYRRIDLGFGHQKVPVDSEALETSSSSIYLSGTVALTEGTEQLNIPFITNFLFTCVKGENGIYKLAWSTSLS